jgi:hypothetical protein
LTPLAPAEYQGEAQAKVKAEVKSRHPSPSPYPLPFKGEGKTLIDDYGPKRQAEVKVENHLGRKVTYSESSIFGGGTPVIRPNEAQVKVKVEVKICHPQIPLGVRS